MNSLPYISGIICGILFVFILLLVIKKVSSKYFGKSSREYDERQKLCQGRAYKIAFYTLIGYLCLSALFNLTTGIVWADRYTDLMLGVLLSIGVFAGVCIFTDAYVPLHYEPRRTIVLLSLLGIFNIGIGLFVNDSIIENGVLTHNCTNLVAGILLIIVSVMQLLKISMEKRGGEQ